MPNHEDAAKKPGFIYGVGAVLGVGLGAASSVAIDDADEGIWSGDIRVMGPQILTQ